MTWLLVAAFCALVAAQAIADTQISRAELIRSMNAPLPKRHRTAANTVNAPPRGRHGVIDIGNFVRGRRATPYVNWTAQGYVTPVKAMGHCGATWAFSTTGAIEGAYYKAKKQLVSFSEEELIECSSPTGCAVGNQDGDFNYVQQNQGLQTEASYPYTAAGGVAGTTCQSKPAQRVPMNLTWSYLTPGDAQLLNAIQTVGPLAVCINMICSAAGCPFISYTGGIMDPSVYCYSSDQNCNLMTLLTGVGTDNGQDYWLLKNSMGSGWGEAGYFRISRSTTNACGINAWPYIVTVF